MERNDDPNVQFKRLTSALAPFLVWYIIWIYHSLQHLLLPRPASEPLLRGKLFNIIIMIIGFLKSRKTIKHENWTVFSITRLPIIMSQDLNPNPLIFRRQAAYEDHLETIESELKLDIKNRKYSTQFVSVYVFSLLFCFLLKSAC